MKRVFLYAHSHWDREWYREFEEFRLRLIEVVDDVLNKLLNGELPCFYFDGQTAAIEDYLEIHPEKEELIKKLISEKKLFIGPFYCSADSLLSSAEFLVRNLKIGIGYSKRFGCNNFIGYLSDTFGHSSCMPEILNSCGIDKAMLWRGLGSLPSEFYWKNIQATYLIQGYFQDFFSLKISYDEKAKLLKNFIDKIAERSSDNILLPCGADHLKVADELPLQIKEINKILKDYKLELASPFDYLEVVKNNYKSMIEGEFLDSSKNFLLKGVYSSRIYQKQQNALCQWNLSRICEPAATICSALKISKNWQNEIDYAYKNTIKNHAHDSIYGCSTDAVHKDVEQRFEHTMQIINGINKRLIRDLSKEENIISFLNLSNFNYSGVIEIETDGTINDNYKTQLISKRKGFTDKKLFTPTEIPITEDYTIINKYLVEVENLPPFSISQGTKTNKETHSISQKSIENNFIKLECKQNKLYLTNKITGKTYKNFIEIVDRADVGDSYNFGAIKQDKPIKAKIISSNILMQGDVKSTLRIVFEINIPYSSNVSKHKRSESKAKHILNVDVSISNLSKYIEFKIDWENKSINHILQVQFNLENPIKTTYSEDLTGITKREFDSEYDIYKQIPAKRGIELKTNTAPMQRFVWSEGVGIVTKGLNEYEIKKNNLLVTILRSTGLISQPLNPCRGTPAGPPIPCKDLQCLGKNTVEFAVTFVKDPKELYKISEEFYGSVIPFFGNTHTDSFFSVDNKNILLQALKRGIGESIIFRFINISDKDEEFEFIPPKGYKKVYITDTCENILFEQKGKVKILPKSLVSLKCKK